MNDAESEISGVNGPAKTQVWYLISRAASLLLIDRQCTNKIALTRSLPAVAEQYCCRGWLTGRHQNQQSRSHPLCL